MAVSESRTKQNLSSPPKGGSSDVAVSQTRCRGISTQAMARPQKCGEQWSFQAFAGMRMERQRLAVAVRSGRSESDRKHGSTRTVGVTPHDPMGMAVPAVPDKTDTWTPINNATTGGWYERDTSTRYLVVISTRCGFDTELENRNCEKETNREWDLLVGEDWFCCGSM